MDRLLCRPALAVDGGAGDVLRKTGGEPARAGDVAGLRTDRIDIAEHDIVDSVGVDAGALDEVLDAVCAEVCRVDLGQSTTAASDGAADGVDDVRGRAAHGRHGIPEITSHDEAASTPAPPRQRSELPPPLRLSAPASPNRRSLPSAPDQLVVTGVAVDDVVARGAEQDVVAARTADHRPHRVRRRRGCLRCRR